MSDNQTFSVDVPTLKDIATNSMPQIAADLGNQAQAIEQLVVPGNSVFGSVVPGAGSLGNQYNAVLEAITALANKFGASVGAGGNSLNTIADYYHRTDHSMAGH